MPHEIEHKFLVDLGSWRPTSAGTLIRQGYLSTAKDRVVRVRIAGESASLTVKGVASGLARPEFEYAIPRSDAEFLLEQLCIKPLIEKTRYREVVGGDRWDIDVFHGDNDGLIVAELEVAREGEPFRRPSWIGREVSTDPRYFNANLVANPYARRRND
jgi:adenylate cyclase